MRMNIQFYIDVQTREQANDLLLKLKTLVSSSMDMSVKTLPMHATLTESLQ